MLPQSAAETQRIMAKPCEEKEFEFVILNSICFDQALGFGRVQSGQIEALQSHRHCRYAKAAYNPQRHD